MVWSDTVLPHERRAMDEKPQDKLLKAASEAGGRVADVLRRLNEHLDKTAAPPEEKNKIAYSNGVGNGKDQHNK